MKRELGPALLIQLADPDSFDETKFDRGLWIHLVAEVRRYIRLDDVKHDNKFSRLVRMLDNAETDRERLRSVSRYLLKMITGLVDKKPAKVSVPLSGSFEMTFTPGAEIVVSLPDFDASFVWRASQDLTAMRSRLRRCKKCQRIFYGRTDQEYCGRTCSNRVAHLKRKKKKSKDQTDAIGEGPGASG
jgi:hypothetical protein